MPSGDETVLEILCKHTKEVALCSLFFLAKSEISRASIVSMLLVSPSQHILCTLSKSSSSRDSYLQDLLATNYKFSLLLPTTSQHVRFQFCVIVCVVKHFSSCNCASVSFNDVSYSLCSNASSQQPLYSSIILGFNVQCSHSHQLGVSRR